MPGSEGGDRVHNFFDQERFSHHHSQVVDGSRLVSSGFHWSGNQKQGSSPVNFSPEQSASDPDRSNLDRHSSLVRGSPFSQSPQRPNFTVNPHLKQHTNFDGYIHDHTNLQARHNDTNIMGVNIELNQHKPFSRGLFNSEAQYGNGSEQYRDTRLEPTESLVNFNFLGDHQKMNNQQLGMLQSSPRQHLGLYEKQLLQQQAVRRNSYEVQMQQQLQQQDVRQTYSVNHLSAGQQKPKDHSASLNDTTPFQDGSNFALMTQHGAENPNWLQGVVSPVIQGTSNGLPYSTEQSASPHDLGFSPQPVAHSLYGFPVTNTRRSSSHYSHSMEKPVPLSRQETSEGTRLPANQYGTPLGQVSAQDRHFGSTPSFQGNSNLTYASNQSSYPGALGKLSPAASQQRNHSMEFQGIQGMLSSSMNSKEKMVLQTGFLQDAAPLDPTEEKFLFGSDDNIWDAFGKSSNSGLDDYNMVESSEFQNPFPSMQSGSWSALMQSALGETCSGDTGNQEEWSGLNLSGNPASEAHEPLAFSDSEKQSRTWVTNGNSDNAPSLDVEHYMSSDRSRATNSYGVQGLPMSNLKSSYDVNKKFRSNSAAKSSQHVPEGNMSVYQSNLKALSEDNQINISSKHPVATLNLKDPSGAWGPQHGTSNNIGNQAYNKYSHSNHMRSVPGEESTMKSTSNENNSHHLQDKQKRFMHEEMQKDNSAWTRNLIPNSPAHMGLLNSNSCMETASIRNSAFDNRNANQKPPTNHHFNHWKHVGSIPELGNENMGRSQHPPEGHPHVSDSSVSIFDKEIPGHSQQSNFWDNTSSNGLQDTVMSGQSDPNVAFRKQKTPDQVTGQSPGLMKFLYHPMGHLDENAQTYFGMKHIDRAQVVSSEHTLFARQGPKSSNQNDKGQGSDSHIDTQKLHEASSVKLCVDNLSNKTFDKSGSSYSTNKIFQSSQNILELLNKANQPRENSAEASRNSSEQTMLFEKSAAESPDASMSRLQRNQSLSSHAYGLQLGPPHQKFPTQIHYSSQSSSQAPNSLSLNSGQLLQCRSSDTSQVEPHGARSGFSGQSGNAVSLHQVQASSGAPITSGFPNLSNQYPNQQTDAGSVQQNNNQCTSADKIISHLEHTDDMRAKASCLQYSVGAQFNAMGNNINSVTMLSSSAQPDKNIQSNARLGQGSFHVGFPSSWTNVPKQQTSSSATPHKSQPNSLASQSHRKTSATPQIQKDDQNFTMRGTDSPGSGARDKNSTSMSSEEDQHTIESSSKFGEPDGTGLAPKATSILAKDGFLSSGIVTHPICETSRTSMKSETKQNSYSLLHQLQVMRSTESDPYNRDSKRLKGQDSSSEAQQSPSRSGQHLHAYNPMVTEIGNDKLVVSGDSKLPNSISELSSNHRYIQHGSIQYQNTPSLRRNDTQNRHHSSPVLSSSPLPQISPQMAPSWFERFGSFNREQLVAAADVWKQSLSLPPELAKTPENSSTSFLAGSQVDQIHAPSAVHHFSDIKHSLATEPLGVEQSSPLQLMAPTTSDRLVSVLPLNCKTATLELIPSHQVVTQDGLPDLSNISSSEAKWASATKRIPEKVIDEVDRAEDRNVMLNHKQRLVLTTQLMQQLLEPPPASVMSSNALMNYETVVYFTSRESCRSACNLSCSKNLCIDHNNMVSKKASKQGDELLASVENEFLVRAAKLEIALSSLENQTSILDLRTEWQDMEKFSVINRFAKFHGRGQADGPATLNSAMNSQRYVTALPSPRNLPDTVQCLSL